MHTVELVEQALRAAHRLGYKIRREPLGDVVPGGCFIQGQKCIFLNLADAPTEQLAVLCDVLKRDPAAVDLDVPVALRRLLEIRRSA